MNKVKCPQCGGEQIVALEHRPNGNDYDTNQLGITDLPSLKNRIYTGVIGDRAIYAIARCLNNNCRISYLVQKSSYRNDYWQVQSINPSVEIIGEGIPHLINEAYRQAQICLATGCPDASIAMCRAALDRMTKDKEADGKTLKARLDYLIGKSVLKSSIVTEAINVRKFGNAALHDLLSEEINNEDAEIICEFTKAILYDIM
ncbi:MAG: DUF4145 domain-containing protein [Dehalococcoidales bacterium]|nr:DUF4145 domain-containing protein [Dehalococcoidales bacterium]